MSRADNFLYLVAGLLLASTGWTGPISSLLWMPAMLLAVVVVTVPMIRGGIARPATALALLLTMVLSFVLFYSLWILHGGELGHPLAGVTGPAAVFVGLFALTGLYEFLIFLGAWRNNEQRGLCGIGFLGVLVQVALIVHIVRLLARA